MKKYDMKPIVDVLDKAIADLGHARAIKSKSPKLKYYRVWMKRTKDADKPDYFIDTIAENVSQASLDAEALMGDYVDIVHDKAVRIK